MMVYLVLEVTKLDLVEGSLKIEIVAGRGMLVVGLVFGHLNRSRVIGDGFGS